MTHICCAGEHTHHDTIHQITQSVSNNSDLLGWNNCYGISCHSKECVLPKVCDHKVCCSADAHYHPNCPTLDMPQLVVITNYPTHQSWWSLCLTSLAHEFRNHRLLQPPVKRRGQRITWRSSLTILLSYSSYIDSLLHSLLSESIINSLNVT